VIPDRAETGETVTLTGSGLGEPGDTVEVLFSPGVAVTVPPGGASRAIYPDHPAFLFGPSLEAAEGETARLAAVHLGTLTVTVTPLDPDRAGAAFSFPVEVVPPARLGTANTKFDRLIVDVAHRYGIPPQYLKAQVHHESAGTFDPSVYRYEPYSFDMRRISKWAAQDWNNPLHEYSLYRMPGGPGLDPADRAVILGSRPGLRLIEAFHPNVMPPAYTCRDLGLPDVDPGAPLLWDLWEANEGWPRCTPPWMLYNDNGDGRCDQWDPPRGRVGPCGRRTNWLNLVRRLEGKPYLTYIRLGHSFFCGDLAPGNRAWECGSSDSDALWFLNHQDYPAQTAIAASYGLLQVMYTTAVERMKWKPGPGRGIERHPAYLLDPAVSLDLGAGYDAELVRDWGLGGAPHKPLLRPADLVAAIRHGIGRFSTGKRFSSAYWRQTQRWVAMYPPLR